MIPVKEIKQILSGVKETIMLYPDVKVDALTDWLLYRLSRESKLY